MNLSHLIVVTCSNYDDSATWPFLPGPPHDAVAMKNVFVEDPATNILADNAFTSISDCTSEQLRRAIDDFVNSRSAPGDVLLFYFSGHGLCLPSGEFAFCCKDTRRSMAFDLVYPMSAVSIGDVLETLAVASITPIFVIDACYSGAAGAAFVSPSEAYVRMDRSIQRVNASSYALLSACTSRQTTGDTSRGGLFTRTFLEAICNGRDDGTYRSKQYLSLDDLIPGIRALLSSQFADTNPQLFLGQSFPATNVAQNSLFSPTTERFVRYYKSILSLCWDNGNNTPRTRADFTANIGPGAYCNHSKLSLPPWQLLEDDVLTDGTLARKLTTRGVQFVNGLLQIPRILEKDPTTGTFAPALNSPMVGFNDL